MTNTDVQMVNDGAKRKGTGAAATRANYLREMLTRRNGATIAQIQLAFSWQPHTARAAISSLRKAGAVVERTDAPKGSVYRNLREDVAQ